MDSVNHMQAIILITLPTLSVLQYKNIVSHILKAREMYVAMHCLCVGVGGGMGCVNVVVVDFLVNMFGFDENGCASINFMCIHYHSQSEPAEILPHLYLGDVSHSSQRPLLDHMGITALLNVSSTCGNHFQSHFRYMNIQVNDNMDADLLSWFPKIIEFIDNVAAEDGKVLVHCRAGVSRSATVCIAYIMQKQGLSLDSAFEFVMNRRPIIDPNLNFIQQLQRFETNLKSKHQLSVSSTSTTYSIPPHSAPLSVHHSASTAFSFCTEDVGEGSDMDLSLPKEDMMSQPDPYHHHQFVTLLSNPPHSPSAAAGDLNLSPSSISQTAASPSPVWSLGLPASRPGSLPLLQISTPLPRSSSSLLTSPSRNNVPYPIAPLLDIFHGPSEAAEAFTGSYTNEPKTPLPSRAFSFFGSDSVVAQQCPYR
ncbi:Dual specificity protein phosphatase 1 [Bulinus truncatus]|nr:Dual specificity protein phosphatase 1 [Bulinus truncatus]